MMERYNRLPPEEQRIVHVTLLGRRARALVRGRVGRGDGARSATAARDRRHSAHPHGAATGQAPGKAALLNHEIAADTGPMAEYPWRPLGELLVERGLIDEYQLEPSSGAAPDRAAIRRAARRQAHRLPGRHRHVIAEQHGLHLDPDRRPVPAPSKAVADTNGGGRWRPIGRILVDKELLTESGLQRVLLAQRRRGGLLGQLLLERGYVTPEQLASALAEQHGVHVPPEALHPSQEQPLDDVVYEVRAPDRDESEEALHVSRSFLDASDFAFELLYHEDPDALEIVELKGGQRRVAWSYERPRDEDREAS